MQKKPDFEETVKHEFKLTGFVNASISPDPINVYFLFTEYSDYVKVTGFFEVNLTFVASTTMSDKVEPCKNFMRRFGLRMEKLGVEEQLAGAQKRIKQTQRRTGFIGKKEQTTQ
ncbi:MAG: hypothetical protein IPO03_01665 [Bacteroidetes bacterium]|nr:hypothetical protein [Bacteroidota bacterium]